MIPFEANPAIAKVLFQRNREQALGALARGEVPPLDNFSFVIDPRLDGDTPAQEFTRHFSNRQIPLLDRRNSGSGHDMFHVPSYQRMFHHNGFANMVQTAATNALASPELSVEFAKAIDRFSDIMSDLWRGIQQPYLVTDARFNLRQLVTLHGGEPQASEQLFATLDAAFQLDKLHELTGGRHAEVPHRIATIAVEQSGAMPPFIP
jgi:hypothetical protein